MLISWRPFGPAGAGRAAATNRVIRGGSFNNNASNLLSSNRNNNDPTNHNNNNGSRCAKTREYLARRSPGRGTGHGSAPRGDP